MCLNQCLLLGEVLLWGWNVITATNHLTKRLTSCSVSGSWECWDLGSAVVSMTSVFQGIALWDSSYFLRWISRHHCSLNWPSSCALKHDSKPNRRPGSWYSWVLVSVLTPAPAPPPALNLTVSCLFFWLRRCECGGSVRGEEMWEVFEKREGGEGGEVIKPMD